ncbi:ABC-type transport auxiliary lipoprotein family protein [Candidatus Williamhamiltonella defendens]|uniref:ABC-type transport auxiliary lipoprotein family protein n=1 Tax=Candidatus Williamhamiltonella defendens TaxID=138072 RepID=UPI001651A1EC|nr:ABC-type transport auxiliary lipoprotein family protein [Candidatus Hamiltonella defensa]
MLKDSLSTEYTQTAQTLWIKPVQLSDYVASDDLTYETNGVRYVTAQRHLWASSLDQQLLKALLINLSHSLLDLFLSSQLFNTNQWRLSIGVGAFRGRYDGSMIISGDWLIELHDQMKKQSFYFELKRIDNG